MTGRRPDLQELADRRREANRHATIWLAVGCCLVWLGAVLTLAAIGALIRWAAS